MQISASITDKDANSLKRYLKELDSIPRISAKEEVTLSRKIAKGDRSALDLLVRSNLKFVVSVAKKYEGLGIPLADLISEGNLGLIRAAESFDETKGFKFITYGVWWIRKTIRTSLNEYHRIIRLPKNQIEKLRSLNKSQQRLLQKYHRPATVRELSEDTGMDEKMIAELLSLEDNMLSLDAKLDQREEDATLKDCIADPSMPADITRTEDLSKEIKRVLAKLPSSEREILKGIFGIDALFPKSIEEIAGKHQIYIDKAKRIAASAITKLRKIIPKTLAESV